MTASILSCFSFSFSFSLSFFFLSFSRSAALFYLDFSLHPSQTYLRPLSSFFMFMHSKWNSRLHSLHDLKLDGVPPFLQTLHLPVFFLLLAAATAAVAVLMVPFAVFPSYYCAYLVSRVPIESFLFDTLSFGSANLTESIYTSLSLSSLIGAFAFTLASSC